MAVDCWIVSAFYIVIFVLLRLGGGSFAIKDILTTFFPISSGRYWFIGCYILLYVLHPAINLVLKQLSQKQFLTLNIGLFIGYNAINVILHATYFYYTNLVGFICIYIQIAYIKRYLLDKITENKCKLILIIGIIALLSQIGMMYFLGLAVSRFSNMCLWWSNFMNPAMIAIAFALLILANSTPFNNRTINSISGRSLLIYMFHDNFYLNRVIKRGYYQIIYQAYGYGTILGWVLLYIAFLIIYSFILSYIYERFLQKSAHSAFNRLAVYISTRFDTLLDHLVRR